ncbi:TetR/AcrR family transcriptional regulator [Hyalangium gracile]|uniref:TetR/AcrR family transcriptional regulator n=1 Tax=Hyalangium gracile TaxID=394092 RepID=UPI001CC906DF|nr:TetR/AcrR family transcriptional regulator [Hyalangium gracile]
MRLTQEQAAENRRKILETAGRLFRERGFDGVGVADLMKAAGFTHGGFYNHFPSKQALAAEACSGAFERSASKLACELEQAPARAWRDFLEHYLSPEHRDDPGQGCTLAALAADAGRQGKEVQESFSEGLEKVFALAQEHLSTAAPDKRKGTEASTRERAIQMMSEVVGAVVLARAVAEADPELSDEILEASRRKFLK